MDMFYLEEDQPTEVPAVRLDPYHLRSCDSSKTSKPTVPVGVVFNSFCADATEIDQKKQQNYFENSNSNYFVAFKQQQQIGSNGDTSSLWRDQSAVNENNQRFFYLGADEDEDCDQKRRDSICPSEDEDFEDDLLSISDEDNVVGFRLDEDSGVGTISNGPSLEEEDKAELVDEPSDLIPVPRSLRFGSVGQRTMRSAKSRKPKLQFTDFYQLTKTELGQGAYACVRTAVHKSTQKEFAVKLVSKHETGHTRSRIIREVEIFKMCKGHPNIVQLIEWFEDENYYYLIFEKMRGGPLLNHIQAKSCFTEEEASKVTKDIASALKFLHDRGIAHRDVKPENILCTDPNHVSPVKLCDLDLASKPALSKPILRTLDVNAHGSENATSRSLPIVHSEPDLQSPVGSAEFMAPEVVDTFVNGDRLKYDKQCDVWSLGVVIYIMLCGYPPFYGRCDNENCGWDQGESCDDCQESLFCRIKRGDFDFPEDDWSEISESAKDLIRHLLVKDVRKRFSIDEVLKHPWVIHEAPQTPLQTVNNLIYRKDSARDISMMNENFDLISRIASNNPTIEESDSSSMGYSPPSPTFTRDLMFLLDSEVPKMAQNTPSILVPGHANPHFSHVNNAMVGGYYVSQSPMINMNGTIICAPQMAPQPGMMGFSHPGNMNLFPPNNSAFVIPQVCNGTTYYTPAAVPPWISSQNVNSQPKQAFQQPRSLQTRESLSGAISKMGLETCQNAMNRQDSSKDIRNQQTRETQVNV